MQEIDALFKKRDAQWAAYCKKRDNADRTALIAVITIIFATVAIIGVI